MLEFLIVSYYQTWLVGSALHLGQMSIGVAHEAHVNSNKQLNFIAASWLNVYWRCLLSIPREETYTGNLLFG